MIIIYLWFGGQLVVLLVYNNRMARVKKYFIVCQGILAGIYPCARLIGRFQVQKTIILDQVWKP